MDDWLTRHMHAILVGVEILWVAGVLAIFVVYFMIKRHVRANKRAAARDTAEAVDDSTTPSNGGDDTQA